MQNCFFEQTGEAHFFNLKLRPRKELDQIPLLPRDLALWRVVCFVAHEFAVVKTVILRLELRLPDCRHDVERPTP